MGNSTLIAEWKTSGLSYSKRQWGWWTQKESLNSITHGSSKMSNLSNVRTIRNLKISLSQRIAPRQDWVTQNAVLYLKPLQQSNLCWKKGCYIKSSWFGSISKVNKYFFYVQIHLLYTLFPGEPENQAGNQSNLSMIKLSIGQKNYVTFWIIPAVLWAN